MTQAARGLLASLAPVTLRLYDTATRTVRPFAPLVPGHAGVYVCGPTPQAEPHVGHLFSAVTLDVLHRWLLASDLTVTFVRNVTDLDDKIINTSAANGEPWWALATRQERAFTRAYDAVGVLPPDATPRVSGSIGGIVTLIARIIERGHAYEANGDVWFSVASDPSYGALSGQDPTQLREGENDPGKRAAADFALWKAAKPGEPSWDSPWGPGRPGWHIECSAMALSHLGETFDLHAGGLDLVFPHHENEIAQSRSAGYGFAQHWVHNGLLSLAGETSKMSKSLGNVVTVDGVLAEHRPAVLRYALATAHYRSPLTWGPTTLTEAETAYGRIETFVRNATAATVGVKPGPPTAWDDFAAAMDDDLGVPQALAVVHTGVRTGNTQLADGDLPGLAVTLTDVRRMLVVLGLDPVTQWPAPAGDLAPVVDALVATVVDARAEARARKDWGQADALRDGLAAAGVVLEDTAAGVRWRLDQPAAATPTTATTTTAVTSTSAPPTTQQGAAE